MNERYEIRTVKDFTALPLEKIGACLTDFKAWLEMVHGAREVESEGEFRMPEGADEVFGWLDDGKHEATVTLKSGDVELFRSTIEFAPPEATR